MKKNLRDSIKRLEQIQALDENWNGYGAKPIPTSVIGTAREVVQALQHQPVICPTARESIQLEYERASGDYLEIELFADDTMGVFRIVGGAESEWTQPIDVAYINDMVDQFCG